MLLAKLERDPSLFRYCTGVTREQFQAMLELALTLMTAPRKGHPWSEDRPPALRLTISLVYLRSNAPMKWLEAVTGISDSAISRCLREATTVWAAISFTPPEPDPHWQPPPMSEGDGGGGSGDSGGGSYSPVVCVDGFLILIGIPRPVGWEAQKPYYSSKHKRHGLKVQIVTRDGRLACLSAARPGSTHDATMLEL